MILYPYKNGSQGAKELADGLGVKQIKKEGSSFKGNSNKLVINWGNSMSTEEVDKCGVLNKPASVAICSNKLSFFRHVSASNDTENRPYVEIPEWTDSRDMARTWIGLGGKVVCRTVLNGHSGAGIVIAQDEEHLVNAPLYVNYVPKKTEYRVHIFNDRVVDVQRKARDHSVPEEQVNWQVRNHQFGFVFVRDENPQTIPQGVLTNSLNAVKVCGLNFGAVDVIYNERHNRATVLEINTAPGLTGITLEGYQQRLKEFGDIYSEIVNTKKRKRNQFAFPALDEMLGNDNIANAAAAWAQAFDQGLDGFENGRIRIRPQAEIPRPAIAPQFAWQAVPARGRR